MTDKYDAATYAGKTVFFEGCAMLAAYSRLPKARVFRRWVLDLLDSVSGEAND